ncbi:hypothetical protein VE03_10383 [Pseudogymnoascus sp. 23342-1-I1]|nr:hypothetical protein VE03_10383 [Pseudogymnoascus sp. 23342-1-I1]
MQGTPGTVTDGSKTDRKESDKARKASKRKEYNRIAQREFRQRRKQKLIELEASQSITFVEQIKEIHRLRTQNDGLRVENEFLKSQLYDPNWCFRNNIALPPVVPPTEHHTPSIVSFAPSILEPATSDGLIWDTWDTQQAASKPARPDLGDASRRHAISEQYVRRAIPHGASSEFGGSHFNLEGEVDFSMIASSSSSFQAMSMTAAQTMTTPLFKRGMFNTTIDNTYQREQDKAREQAAGLVEFS